ncbi:MAG: diacylglycerol kinase family protein [Patescibacteria group bacterium]
MKFHTAVIIYNPNSTGDSEKNAKQFAKELRRKADNIDVSVVATKSAGHAEEIAAQYAGKADALIVSSSGDGGYNEVVNGVLVAGGKCTVAVLPSGNANDHHRAVAPSDMIDSIVKGKTRTIEAIMVKSIVDGKSWQRYAHSYVGFGLTPQVGKILTDVRPNVLTEKWHVLRHIFSFKHVTMESDGKVHRYHSLVVATIDRMSKVIKLDESANFNDGKMEVYESKYLSPFRTLKELLFAGVRGVSRTSRTHRLVVTTTKPLLVQLDGEVFTLDGKSEVVLTCEKDSIKTLA